MSAFSLNSSDAFQFMQRAASYSTHGSRRGYSFLSDLAFDSETQSVSEADFVDSIKKRKGFLTEILTAVREELGITKNTTTKRYLAKFVYDEDGAPIAYANHVPTTYGTADRNADFSKWNRRGFVKLLKEAHEQIVRVEAQLVEVGCKAIECGGIDNGHFYREFHDYVRQRLSKELYEKLKSEARAAYRNRISKNRSAKGVGGSLLGEL